MNNISDLTFELKPFGFEFKAETLADRATKEEEEEEEEEEVVVVGFIYCPLSLVTIWDLQTDII